MQNCFQCHEGVLGEKTFSSDGSEAISAGAGSTGGIWTAVGKADLLKSTPSGTWPVPQEKTTREEVPGPMSLQPAPREDERGPKATCPSQPAPKSVAEVPWPRSSSACAPEDEEVPRLRVLQQQEWESLGAE